MSDDLEDRITELENAIKNIGPRLKEQEKKLDFWKNQLIIVKKECFENTDKEINKYAGEIRNVKQDIAELKEVLRDLIYTYYEDSELLEKLDGKNWNPTLGDGIPNNPVLRALFFVGDEECILDWKFRYKREYFEIMKREDLEWLIRINTQLIRDDDYYDEITRRDMRERNKRIKEEYNL